MEKNIKILNDWCQNSKVINSILPSGISYISAENPPETIIYKDISDLLRYILEIDEIKSKTPDISTDFFFYRRCKNKISEQRTLPIGEQDSNNISMLIGHKTPFIKTSHDTLDQGDSTAALVLSKLINFNFAYSKTQTDMNIKISCFETIVSGVLISDMLLPDGVFGNKSPLKMDNIVDELIKIGREGLPFLRQIKYNREKEPSYYFYIINRSNSKAMKKLENVD